MKVLFSILLLSSIHYLAAQVRGIKFLFVPTFNNQEIELGKNYKFETEADSIFIETLRFYISELALFQNDERVFSPEKKHFLIDVEKPESRQLSFQIDKNVRFNSIRFGLGIDSLTSVSGVFGEDLDPTKGMYWTWQSGYIHFKLEGITERCPARNHQFQYHLGGYQDPFNTYHFVELKIPDSEKISIQLSIDTLFKKINVAETYEIMSPNEKAVEMAHILSTLFYISE